MKKLLPLLTLCIGLCCVSCYDDSPILERLDALEKNAIASINEQISAIKSSITSLEAVDKELKATIQTLEAKDASQQGEIDKLKEADASLETKIGELKTYVDEEISNTEDWATATFATIEKYNEIIKDLSSLKEVVESNYATLDKKIDDSIESIKVWVNEALKGYYTSAEVDELLTSLKDDLDALQAQLDNLLRDFIITFEDTEIGILAGGTTSVGYTITGATDKTTVKALGQNGWSAKVTPEGIDKGKITVTAPNPLTEDEIIVLVYDGEYRTIMSSINFVTGTVTPSQTAVELEAEAGTVDITVTSNLNYKVSIPDEAKEWLSVVETKATKTETITFAYTECVGGIRNATVSFEDEANNTISSMTFVQQGSAVEVTLTEAGTLLSKIGEDVYKSIKGLIITGPINGTDIKHIRQMSKLCYLDLTNSTITKGGDYYMLYNGHEFYTADGKLGDSMFSELENLETIIFPNDITSISYKVCYKCPKLTTVIIHNKVTTIENFAFEQSKELSVVKLSENLISIGHSSFALTNISDIELPSSLQNISAFSFGSCNIKSITIPSNVIEIGTNAFGNCPLEVVYITASPNTLTHINNDAFYGAYSNATLYIPTGTLNSFKQTELGRFTTIKEI